MTQHLLTILLAQGTDHRLFPPFRSSTAFELKVAQGGVSRLSYFARRLPDGATFEVTLSIHNKVRDTIHDYASMAISRSSAIPNAFNRVAPSGMPTKYFYLFGQFETWSVCMADDHGVARASIRAPMDSYLGTVRGVQGVVVNRIRKVDMTPALPVLEQVGRFSLSAFLGTKSVAKPGTAFAGTSLATRESAYSDTRFVRLESAAKAAGWSMAKGEHNITAQLTKAGRPTLIFVAAAPSFKKGPTWTDLPDVPLIVDDELWVPTTALASL